MFELMPIGSGWMEKVLYSFCSRSNCADGDAPEGGLIMDAAGNLYGTTLSTKVDYGAVFELVAASTSYSLSVSELGPGAVTSSPAGINCPGTCSASFAPGTDVSLSETPAGGWNFLQWDGACAGNGGCAVTMGTNQNVMATFWTDGSSSPSVAGPSGMPAVQNIHNF